MKFKHFAIIWALLLGGLIELVSRQLFQISTWDLLNAWYHHADTRWPIILMIGFFGMLFVILIAIRTTHAYLVTFGKPFTYVFTGDRLREGFYGYKEHETPIQEEFISTALDMNVYPNTSFNALFYRRIVYRGPAGETVHSNFLHAGNLIVWSILAGFVFVLFICGWLLVFKGYAILQHLEMNDSGVKQIAIWVHTHLSRTLFYTTLGIAIFPLICLLLIKWKAQKTNDESPVCKLPKQITQGSKIEGKVIASETYTEESNTKRKIYDPRIYKRFTIQFSAPAGFNIPVYVNWDVRDVKDYNLKNKSKLLKQELNLQKQYYGAAFIQLEAAQENQSSLPFLITQDLCLLPYIEELKDMIPEVLTIE